MIPLLNHFPSKSEILAASSIRFRAMACISRFKRVLSGCSYSQKSGNSCCFVWFIYL